MKKRHLFAWDFSSSSGLDFEHSSASTYLAAAGIVLSASVLSISSAQARGIAPIEVFVYEGKPIDYSNRSDVFVIYDSSYQDEYAESRVTRDSVAKSTTKPASKVKSPTTIQNNTTVANAANVVKTPAPVNRTTNKAQPTKLAAPKALAIANIEPVPQVQLSKPFDKPINQEDPELMVFYANAMKLQQSERVKQRAVAIAKVEKRIPIKTAVKKKPKTNEIQLALRSLETKVINPPSVKKVLNNTKVKDPELVAFYRDVFAEEKTNLSNQSVKPITVIAKQIPSNNITKQKTITIDTTREVQLAVQSSKAKDPELVAFYHQVFVNDNVEVSQPAPVVAKLKTKAKSHLKTSAKDPDLVAFYEREFGKGSIAQSKNKKSFVITKKTINKTINKTKKLASANPHKKSMAKKAVSKVHQKTVALVSAELAELQELIDDLTAKNII